MQAKTFFFWLHIVLMVKTVYIDALQRKTGKGGEEKEVGSNALRGCKDSSSAAAVATGGGVNVRV